MKRNSTLALAIDFQERLIPAMKNEDELVANAEKFFEGLGVLGVPVIITQQYTKGLGETIWEVSEAIVRGMEYGAEAQDGESKDIYLEYVEKLSYSAFEDIKEQIGSEVETVIVSGVESHICVLQTAIDLKKAGYEVVLCTDCISSRKEIDYETAVKRAAQEGILLATHEMILFELLGKAGTPEAKAIQRIVK